MNEQRRIIVNRKLNAKEWEECIQWAAQNDYDALIIPLQDTSVWDKLKQGRGIAKIAERCGMVLEAGGWELSLLLPRGRFFFQRDLFRMDYGRRTAKYNFCPTNPRTIELIEKEAARLFSRAAAAQVFHLWPDRGHEKNWCACPACRAFSPAEQNRIAINSTARALAHIAPQARLSYLETAGGDEDNGNDEAERADSPAESISPAQNVFAINGYPDEWKM